MNTKATNNFQFDNPTEFNNPVLYKRTTKKQSSIYVCMPKIGSKVNNRLDLTHHIVDEVNNRFVVCGTAGENYTTSLNEIMKNYTFDSGEVITERSIANKAILININGDTRPCGDRLIPDKILHDKNVVCLMDWVKLRSKPFKTVNYWACFVPNYYSFVIQDLWGGLMAVNDQRTLHGAGDFIVCGDINDTPNLNDKRVINGEIFTTLFDMRAFPNITVTSNEVKIPESILKKSNKFVRHEEKKETLVNKSKPIVDKSKPIEDKSEKFIKEKETFGNVMNLTKINIEKSRKILSYNIKNDGLEELISQCLINISENEDKRQIAIKVVLLNKDNKPYLEYKMASNKKTICNGTLEFTSAGAKELISKVCKMI